MSNFNENKNMENSINIVNSESASLENVAGKADARRSKQRIRERSHEFRSQNKKPFPFLLAFLVVVFTVLLMMCVSNYVALNEYTKEVSELKKDLEDLKAEEKKLSAELDKKYDLVEIDRYAKEKLGMVNLSDVDKKYIEVGDDEKIEVYEVEEDGTMGAITTALFALADSLIESWNNLISNE